MKKINTDFKYLLGLWILLILAILPVITHHGHYLVDCGREVYYPTQILMGKILYKDLFNIYGPFSYMFNAFLFKMFGIHLNVLYASGCACAVLIVSLIYLISKRFLSRFLSFSLSVFTIVLGVFNLSVFNFIFPYSYAMLYGLVAFLASVWFLLKYQSNPDKVFYLYLGGILAGLCVASKYEFLTYFLVVLYVMIKVKPLKFVQYYYTILALAAVPIFCFGTLFLQGLWVSDLVSTFVVLGKMAHSQTLRYFYTVQGIYLSKMTIPFLLESFVVTGLTLFCLLKGAKSKYWLFFYLLSSLGFLFVLMQVGGVIFTVVPLFIVVMAILDRKNLKENFALQILTFSAILFSLKIFTGMLVYTYGMFFISFLLITALALSLDKFREKEINQKVIGVYFIILAILVGFKNLYGLQFKTQSLHTHRGTIHGYDMFTPATRELIDYINTNTKKTDTVVIFPEGLFINFLTDRKSDDYYNSLIPLYDEVFGDEKLIEHFKKTRPEYIIFDNWDNSDYYLGYICKDYAVSFCNYVATNYKYEKVIDNGFRYLIYKRK